MELLKKLCGVTAPSGNEEPIREVLISELSGFADESPQNRGTFRYKDSAFPQYSLNVHRFMLYCSLR